jgi:hypothetical protein
MVGEIISGLHNYRSSRDKIHDEFNRLQPGTVEIFSEHLVNLAEAVKVRKKNRKR